MKIKTVGVVGAGQMGSGIAQIASIAGYDVVIYDISEEMCFKSRSNIQKLLDRQVAKGKMTAEQVQEIMGRLTYTSEMKDFAGAEAVIEAVPEILSLKQKIFAELGDICREDTLLCTNTSSLSIGDITRDCIRPERCAGMHFFFPVNVMKLVEIIRSVSTTDETVSSVRALTESLGKIPVICQKDTAGFIVNRCLFAFFLEAIREYEDGIATIEDIDTAIKYGLNHPLGPFELIDLTGIDTFEHVAEKLEELPVTDWSCPKSIKEKVEQNHLGRKTGEGWYKY